MALEKPGAVCLDCRSALRAGEACYVDRRHEIAYLASSEGRELLVARTWGGPETRTAKARERASAERTLLALGLLPGMSTLLLLLEHVPLGVAHVVAPLAVAAGFNRLGRYVAGKHAWAEPRGARVRVAPDGSGPGGWAVGEEDTLAPASGMSCLGYAIELLYVQTGAEHLMFRDAVSGGFEVELDDGRIAEIPPGRVILVGRRQQVMHTEPFVLDAYLRHFDPLHGSVRRDDPLRYNVIHEHVVRLGDRVELLSRFEPRAVPTAAPRHYREPASSHLHPCELPILLVR